MISPFEKEISESIGPIYDDLSSLGECPESEVERVLGILLDYACRAQHIGNIVAARKSLQSVPAPLLRLKVIEVAQDALNLEDDWEFRRFLEALDEIAPVLLDRALEIGRHSPHAEIRDAVKDFE